VRGFAARFQGGRCESLGNCAIGCEAAISEVRACADQTLKARATLTDRVAFN
jgi:hypothetical protein